MNKYAIKESRIRVVVWIVWFVVVLAALGASDYCVPTESTAPLRQKLKESTLLGVVSHDARRAGPLFPWQSQWRWKKWALHKYRTWQAGYRQAKRAAQMARLALTGVLTMAQVVDWLTASQLGYKLGALPVLYALLETLQVREIINRHCPTQADVEHGTVLMVLVLNRLMLPLPLYQMSDWIGQTVLVAELGIPAAKFNDDRLGRTLDALYPHLDAIWQEIVGIALVKAQIDLSVLFYDVTAIIGHGRYKESKLMDFGFAHNTPSNKRKLKLGVDASADGNIPVAYAPWSGRTSDQATVQSNMENLACWLKHHGQTEVASLIIGDRAMLSAELAIAYDKHGLRHLTGLRAATPELKKQIAVWSDAQFEAFPIEEGPSPHYWGRGTQVTFTHEGESVTHKALVVVSGPLRDQLRQSRQALLGAVCAELETLKNQIGQPRLTTLKAVQRSVNSRLRLSKIAEFVQVTIYESTDGQVKLFWQLNAELLAQAERMDGRYLLVTNDRTLSHHEIFRLYRAKDGVETCFHICKDDLAISPLYLHQDKRIASMLFVNMVALLAYNLLQRQMQKQGMQMTTRRLIQRLDQLTVIETHCWDGSSLRRFTPVDPALTAILELVFVALADLVQTVAGPSPEPILLASPPVRQLPPLC
ncbi:MAG: IS1634 family transposase [Gallionella sp.]|nr:IS1634 family transposase [Gallionella sp.]